MMDSRLDRMRELVSQLNRYRDAYYNKSLSLVPDAQYDELFDELTILEKETGTILTNSPTQTVGYTVQSELEKIKHSHPMLSLGKTKQVQDIIKFAEGKIIIGMTKCDGLTCSLYYNEDGDLVRAETRGDGITGENVTENAKHIANIPLKINNNGKPLTIDGEVIVGWDTFKDINSKLSEEESYSHPRNLASGSIRQLDTKVTADRKLRFIAWRVIEGIDNNNFFNRLAEAGKLGFEIVPMATIDNLSADYLNKEIELLKSQSDVRNIPADGLVFTYNDIKYGESLGETGHHPRHSMAFKFTDEEYETTLRNIEWQVGRTGAVTPVAIFNTVDMDGTLINRASLHNVSIMKELKLGIGDTITVYRANQVIPQIKSNLTNSDTYEYPTHCPCCGEPLELRKDGIAEVFYCNNEECTAKMLAKFEHFVSKPCANIEGLSTAQLELFIGLGFIKTFKDIYHLKDYKEVIQTMEGFGPRSCEKLLQAIEASRNIKLENYINALGISLIGKSASKEIAKAFKTYNDFISKGPEFDFTTLNDFGEAMSNSMIQWFKGNHLLDKDLGEEFVFEEAEVIVSDGNFCEGKTFVITGALSKPRSFYEDYIIKHGGKLSGSVSKKTNYLVTNETAGTSKYLKAQELGIPIINENQFLEKAWL